MIVYAKQSVQVEAPSGGVAPIPPTPHVMDGTYVKEPEPIA